MRDLDLPRTLRALAGFMGFLEEPSLSFVRIAHQEVLSRIPWSSFQVSLEEGFLEVFDKDLVAEDLLPNHLFLNLFRTPLM